MERLLDLGEVATGLGVSTRTVRRLCEAGKLRYTRVGRIKLKFKKQWIEDYINRR